VTGRWHLAATASPSPLVDIPRLGHADDDTAQSEPPVDVSFVVVTFGTGPIVVDAITALVAGMAGTDLSFEAVVVDNQHPEATNRARNELALSTRGVSVLSPGRNLGFGGGCELGALFASGRVLAFVNPDLVVSPGWILPLLETLESGASIVAPVMLNSDGSIQEAGRVVHADGSTSACRNPDELATGETTPDYASAACWLIRRDEHERLGGFDPAFHPAYYEDVEFAIRASALGGGLAVATDVTVVHHQGMGTHANSRTADTSAQRDVLLARVPRIRWTRPARPGALR